MQSLGSKGADASLTPLIEPFNYNFSGVRLTVSLIKVNFYEIYINIIDFSKELIGFLKEF